MKKVDELYNKNIITYGALAKICRQNAAQTFAPWADKVLLFLGAALFVAGVIFFFAFNWFLIPKFVKLAVCMALILASAAAAFVKGFDSYSGQAAGTAAAVFVGAFLAVFGQIYQTGANAYDLFLMWTVMTLPLALCMNKTSGWVLFVILVNVTLALSPLNPAIWIFCLVNFAFLLVTLLPFKIVKQQPYFEYLINTYITVLAVIDSVDHWENMRAWLPLVWAAVLFSIYFFRRKNIYFLGLSLGLAGYWAVVKLSNVDAVNGLWGMGMIILIISGLIGFTLVKINAKFKGAKND
ncbi:MAG: DUF2157 domain-containing protein [Elusimicrobia bacterium]|nr:DUF2157 domain-containing protein [Elusimicrobiota bacterium]